MSKINIFENNDNEYLDWMNNSQSYFIVNTFRNRNSNFFALHKSKCPHISTTVSLEKGAYTERKLIKVGSNDLAKLKNWFTDNYSQFRGEFTECKTCKPYTEKFYDNEVFLFPEIVEKTEYFEGAKKQVFVNIYERNFKARRECLKFYGYNCAVCNVNFEESYGIIGKDFIHVHHLKEISEIKTNYKINPIDDLRPVCPNCHAMLHQRKPCYSIAELKEIITNIS